MEDKTQYVIHAEHYGESITVFGATLKEAERNCKKEKLWIEIKDREHWKRQTT